MEDPNQMENLAHKEDPTYMEGCKILPATMLTTPGVLKSIIHAGRVTGAVLLQEVQMLYKEVKEDPMIIQGAVT